MIEADFNKHYFSDAELARIEAAPDFSATCPVCQGEMSFVYNGKAYDCPDDDYGHIALRKAKLYWLANIPLEYQQLVWEEWLPATGDADAMKTCDDYIKRFTRYALNGVGLTFSSPGLGTGKTWAATATLKRIVKAGVDGWFAPFYQVKSYYEIVDPTERAYKIKRVQEARVLVLDEVGRPGTSKQHAHLAEKLEELIRPRTSANLPTLITTNLTPEEIEEWYPRSFSLLYAKNIGIELGGADARLSNKPWKRSVESVANGEALPIT